jgi:quercetin dioxygenase-like cupin family protein
MTEVSVAQWHDAGRQPLSLEGQGATMRQIFIPAGTVSARHSHPHEQFLRVISGDGQLECAEGQVSLKPGTALRLAPGAWHSAVFSEDTVLLELNLTPPA